MCGAGLQVLMNREARIFRATVLSTLALAAVALYGLMQQGVADRRRSQAAVMERAGGIADDLREQIREAGTGAAARQNSLAAAFVTPPEGLTAKPIGAFVWEPKNAVVWKKNVPEELAVKLAARTRWLDWSAPGRKSPPRRAMAEIEGGSGTVHNVLWGRVDNALYALVFDRPPIQGDFSWWLWTALAFGVMLAAAAVVYAAVALRRAAEQERLNNELKTQFIADVTHDLKTPIASMGLWTDLLRSGRLPSEERRSHAVEVVVEEKNRMLRMIEQLLEYLRLDENRREYKVERVDVGEQARNAGALLKGDFSADGLVIEAPEGMMACADQDAVRRILVNLLGNAAKYAADEGVVEVEVSRSDRPVAAKGEGEWIQVRVSDHGPGIPEEWRDRLFERFRRGNDQEARAKGGFGLGLPISRQLARDMGGELSVHSRPDDVPGALFLLELPSLLPSS